MKVETIQIGMKVNHPQYGAGTVKSIGEHTVDVRFDNGETRTVSPETSDLRPAEPQMTVSGLSQPLRQFVEDTVQSLIRELGLAKPDSVVEQLGTRWQKGRMVLHPADPALQTKELPLEVFFHKIVLMRNNLRVLEQKINSNPGLSEGDKVDLQQYITRCYGSMTTFNVLFKNKEDHFAGSATS